MNFEPVTDIFLLLLLFLVNFIHFPNPKFLEIRRASFRRAAPSSPSPVPTNTPYWCSKSASPCETLIKSTSKRREKQQQGERREGCQKLCQQEYDQERETYEERERQHRGDGGSSEYQDCRRECQQGRRGDKEDCEERCDRRHGRHGRHGGGNCREWEETREGSNSSPYVFEDRHFVTGIKSQHGPLRILQKFTERSELLGGIENFRVGIFEAQPQTFVVPNHCDADTLIFVANGFVGTPRLLERAF